MKRLWHTYALALSLAALLPLTIVTWFLAERARDEVVESTRELQYSVADTASAAVRTLVDGALKEANAIGATVALADMGAEERLRAAQAQLIGAKYLTNFSIYTPEGEDIQHMQGANADRAAVGGEIVPPAPLPEVLRADAKAHVAAYSELIRRPGAMFLPITVSILDKDGAVYAYGWTAVSLEPLSETIEDLSKRRFGEPGLVSLIDSRKHVVAAAARERIDQPFAAGSDLATPWDLRHDLTLMLEYARADVPRIGVLTSLEDLGWGVIVEQDKAVVFARVGRITTTAVTVGAAFAALALLVGVLLGRRLSAPIAGVSHAAGKVAGGDFTVKVPVVGRDEVGQLGRAFNAMTAQLTTTIAKLQETTAAKERMQTELDIGRNIQMSMVPLAFPAFPERRDFDVHAALKPAFEVGGDFYDFFLIDDDTLCVCIADVSGKGVPAALFMAVTRTLVKTHAKNGASPDEILEKVNDDLAKDNDACMFVTLFLGLVDLKSGTLTFTNAGHNPSYIRRAGAPARVERLDQLHGPVVAAMDEVPYGFGTTTLGAGDTLFLYTDGVNEAMNAKKELFTEERLAKLLTDATWSSSDGVVKLVLDDVWRFQGEAEQADDVTVVALRWLGPPPPGDAAAPASPSVA